MRIKIRVFFYGVQDHQFELAANYDLTIHVCSLGMILKYGNGRNTIAMNRFRYFQPGKFARPPNFETVVFFVSPNSTSEFERLVVLFFRVRADFN